MRPFRGTTAPLGLRQLLPLLALATAAAGQAQPGPVVAPQGGSEAGAKAASVRAAILFKLASYLTWETTPPESRKLLRIGLLGTDPTAEAALKVLPGKVLGTAIVAVVVVDPALAREGRAHEVCDVLYVAASVEDGFVAHVVTAHVARPMPTVCERAGFAAQGGSIQLFVEDKNVRFEINPEALRHQGVRASSQLLKLSRKGPVR